MFETLLAGLPAGNKRHPLTYYRLLDTISARLDLAQNKFRSAQLPRTAGVELLRYILLNCNLEAAKAYQDDISLYTNLLNGYQDEFRSAFDPVWCKTLSSGKFVHSTGSIHPTEVFVNASLGNPSDYPFSKGWEEWKYVRSVKILYHNSTELPIDMFTGYVTFRERPPTFVVISINTAILLMKWIKYCQYCEEHKKESPNELNFIKESEFDQFFQDLFEVWTTNLLNTVLLHPDAPTKQICSELSVPAYITSDKIVENGVAGLQSHLSLIKDRNLKIVDFLATNWYPDETSMRERMLDMDDVVIPETRQYLWIDLLKSLPYVKMLAAVAKLDEGNPQINQLRRKAYWMYVKKIRFVNLPSMQYSNTIKTYIGMASKEFEELFDDETRALLEDTSEDGLPK